MRKMRMFQHVLLPIVNVLNISIDTAEQLSGDPTQDVKSESCQMSLVSCVMACE